MLPMLPELILENQEIESLFRCTVTIAMAGGAPIPIPTANLDEKILSIKDLEKAANKKLAQSLKGKRRLLFS